MSSKPEGTPQDPAAIVSKNIALDFENLKAKYDALVVENDTLKGLHAKLVKVVDDINRAKLIKMLGDTTKLTVEDMEKMPTDELMNFVDTIKLVKKPFVSIKDSDEEASTSRLTVPSKFRFAPK